MRRERLTAILLLLTSALSGCIVVPVSIRNTHERKTPSNERATPGRSTEPAVPIPDLPPNDGKRARVAVVGVGPQGLSTEQAAVVADALRRELLHTDYFDVMERLQVQAILSERDFQSTDCFTHQCAVDVGKLLKVEHVAYGSLYRIGRRYQLEVAIARVDTGRVKAAEAQGVVGNIESLPELATAVARKLALAFRNQ